MNNNDLGTENIPKLLAKYSFPAIISMVIAGMQTIVDGIFLGNFVGQYALVCVNLVQPFMQIIIGYTMIISVGSLSFLGRSLGEGKKAEAQNIFKTALISIIIVAFIVVMMTWFFTSDIAKLLGATSSLLAGVSIYVRTIVIFAPLISTMFLFGFANRVLGRPNLYLKGMMLCLMTNIFLDYLLIKQFGLGIKGAALATGISYVVAFIIVAIPILDKEKTINAYKGKFEYSKFLEIVFNGSSEGVTSIAIATTAYVFNMVFMKIAGEDGVASFTTINYLAHFGSLIMFGISDGITPILSYNYGNRKPERVEETLKLATKINILIGVVLFLALSLFGRQLVSLFVNDNSEVINLAVSGSRIYAFAFLLCGYNIIHSGYFTAIGDAKKSIIIATCRGILFIILGINILPYILGMNGVWLTMPFAELMTFIISVFLVRKSSQQLGKELAIQKQF